MGTTVSATSSSVSAPILPSSALPASLTDSPVITFWQVAMALCLVLLCIWVVAWLARRFLQHGGGLSLPTQARVISAISLGGRERLVIVEIADTWLVLGVSAGGVSHLHTLPKPEHTHGQASDLMFAERLKSFLLRGQTKDRSSEQDSNKEAEH